MTTETKSEKTVSLFSAKILKHHATQGWPVEDTDTMVDSILAMQGRLNDAAIAWNSHTDSYTQAAARRRMLSVTVELATLAMVLAESTGALEAEEPSPLRRAFDRALPGAVERLGEIAGKTPAGLGRAGPPDPEPEDLAEALERQGHTLPGGHLRRSSNLPSGRVGDVLGGEDPPKNAPEDVARQLENLGISAKKILRVVKVAIPVPEEQTDFSRLVVRSRFDAASDNAMDYPDASYDVPVVLSRDDIRHISQYLLPPLIRSEFDAEDVSVMADILYEHGVEPEVAESEARATLEKIYNHRLERLAKKENTNAA